MHLGMYYGVHLEKDAHNYKLYSNKVPCFRLQLPLLFIIYIFILFCSTVAFVSEFFINESSQCDENLDCFAIDSTRSPVHQYPLSNNCIEFKESGHSIKCFRFALDYVSGISVAGGVMVIGSLLMNIQAAAWAAFSYLNGGGRLCAAKTIICLLYFMVCGLVLVLHAFLFILCQWYMLESLILPTL